MGSPLRQEIHVVPSPPAPPPKTELVYRRNEQPRSTHDWILYSFQWLVTIVYAVVWGYVGLNFGGARMTTYLSAVVLTIGVSTLLQAWLGHRMAMVHGPNVIPSLAIVAALAAGGAEEMSMYSSPRLDRLRSNDSIQPGFTAPSCEQVNLPVTSDIRSPR